MIEIENLRLVIEGKDVLKGVDLHLEAGDVYGLLGPNGAGKFTTMYALLGLRSYAGGLVSVLGNDPAVDPIPIRRQVGGMSEKAGFYEWMTAIDYADRLAHAADKGRRLPRGRQRYGSKRKAGVHQPHCPVPRTAKADAACGQGVVGRRRRAAALSGSAGRPEVEAAHSEQWERVQPRRLLIRFSTPNIKTARNECNGRLAGAMRGGRLPERLDGVKSK